MSKIYGYIRASKSEIDLRNQKNDILNSTLLSDVEKKYIIWTEETVSGKVFAENRELGSIIQKILRGDTLICADVSRLGRNTLDVASIGSDIMKRKARLVFARENWELKDDIGSEVLFFAFSLAARIERSMISARTKSGLETARKNGNVGGKPRGSYSLKLVGKETEIRHYKEKGLSDTAIGKIYGVNRVTIAKFLAKKTV